MIVLLKPDPEPRQVARLTEWLKSLGLDVHLSEGTRRTVIGLIRLMGNAGLKHAGQEPDLTDEWLIDHIKPGYTTSYRIAVMGAVTAGWFMESDQGEKEQDDVLAEIRKKNGNTD